MRVRAGGERGGVSSASLRSVCVDEWLSAAALPCPDASVFQCWLRGFTVSKFRRAVLPTCAALIALGLSGCAGGDHAFVNDPFGAPGIIETSALPETAKHVAEGKNQYAAGHYGLAADAFAKSVELDALNPLGWLGLAASYDQIGRFDEADKAYNKVQQLIGATPSVLNNLGYSYLLRGNLDKSRATLAAAYANDPGNPYIHNNIDILNQRLVTLGQPPMVMN